MKKNTAQVPIYRTDVEEAIRDHGGSATSLEIVDFIIQSNPSLVKSNNALLSEHSATTLVKQRVQSVLHSGFIRISSSRKWKEGKQR